MKEPRIVIGRLSASPRVMIDCLVAEPRIAEGRLAPRPRMMLVDDKVSLRLEFSVESSAVHSILAWVDVRVGCLFELLHDLEEAAPVVDDDDMSKHAQNSIKPFHFLIEMNVI